MIIIQKIAEQRIKEAMEEGLFNDLPGRGEKLRLDDDSHLPEDLKMAYKILKNANCTPPELALKKDIKQIEDMLETISDEKEKYKQLKRLNFLVMKLNMMRNRAVNLEEDQRYLGQIVDKLGDKKVR